MSRHETFAKGPAAGAWWALGPGGDAVVPASGAPLLARGALLVETRPGALEAGDPLIDWQGRGGLFRRLRLTLSRGRLRLLHTQGPIRREAVLDGARPAPGAALRIAYGWDGPNRHWRLDLEEVAGGRAWRARGADPMPLPVADAAALVAGPAPALAWLALTDTFGRPTGTVLAPDSIVRTLAGPRRVGELVPGERLLGDNGAVVVEAAERVAMPAMGPFAPLRIGAHSLGAHHDLTLCPR